MNGPWFSRCGEKLSFARVVINAARVAGADDPLRAAVRDAALAEAAVFHLHGAWLAFLNEVAENSALGGSPVADSTELLARADAAGVDSEALREVARLESDPGSWVGLMERAWQGTWVPRPAPARAAADAGQGSALLAVQAAEPSGSPPDTAACLEWLQAMQSLVERLREGMEEW